MTTVRELCVLIVLSAGVSTVVLAESRCSTDSGTPTSLLSKDCSKLFLSRKNHTMKQATITKPELVLVGVKARTNNAREMDPKTAVIGTTLYQYAQEKVAEKIENRKNPGVTFCVYTEYESDHTGDYTYFVGEEVNSLTSVPEGLTTLSIPAQTYSKYTTEPGPMPAVVIKAWQDIWHTTPQEMGAEREYCADFELYDERALDPQATVVDIYIGIKPYAT